MTLREADSAFPLLELELEHASSEIVLRGFAELWVGGRRIAIDKLVLDTGLTFGLAAPADAISDNELDDPGGTMVATLGQSVFCQQGTAELRLGPHWQIPVITVIGMNGRDWLVGYHGASALRSSIAGNERA